MSTKCPFCKTQLPNIKAAQKFLDSLGYERATVFILYNTEEEIGNFIGESRLEGRYYHDDGRKFSRKYGPGWIPVFFVIDEKGNATRFNRITDSLETQVRSELKSCCLEGAGME
jgi:hypothetical protein